VRSPSSATAGERRGLSPGRCSRASTISVPGCHEQPMRQPGEPGRIRLPCVRTVGDGRKLQLLDAGGRDRRPGRLSRSASSCRPGRDRLLGSCPSQRDVGSPLPPPGRSRPPDSAWPVFAPVEIRCDEANTVSASVARRLGYRLERIEDAETGAPGGDWSQHGLAHGWRLLGAEMTPPTILRWVRASTLCARRRRAPRRSEPVVAVVRHQVDVVVQDLLPACPFA
jgi:hypothetical protein